MLGVGAGEGAALVAEQLALDQVGRNGAAVEHHERLVGAGAGVVDEMREDVLAGPRLAGQRDGHVGGRQTRHHGVEIMHCDRSCEVLAETPD